MSRFHGQILPKTRRMMTIKRTVPNPPEDNIPSFCYAATVAMHRKVPEEEPQSISFRAFSLLAFLHTDRLLNMCCDPAPRPQRNHGIVSANFPIVALAGLSGCVLRRETTLRLHACSLLDAYFAHRGRLVKHARYCRRRFEDYNYDSRWKCGLREGLNKSSRFPRRLKPRSKQAVCGGTKVPPFQNVGLCRDFLGVEDHPSQKIAHADCLARHRPQP